MTMDHVRVRRDNLLQRFMKVDREGAVSINGNPKIMFSTMMKTRIAIYSAVPLGMMQGLQIAMRYSVCRRQFKNTSGSDMETKILDY